MVNEEIMSPEDFIKSVENNFYKHFPNGIIKLTHKLGLGNTYHISATFGMIGNIKDNNGGYHDNDNMRHAFIMFQSAEDVWSFKTSLGAIYLNPSEGSYNAMDSIRTKMGNNTKITLAKADKKLEKFFKKLVGLMKDNVDNIYGVDKIDKKYLVFK